MVQAVNPDLVEGLELLSLDAGNTIVFLDHARIAGLLEGLHHGTTAEALVVAEGEAKHLHVQGRLVRVPWSSDGTPGAASWAEMLGTVVHRAGVPLAELPRVLEALWAEHRAFNLWSLVPEGLGEALDELRATGAKVVVVSNSEGKLAGLFDRLGIARHFDSVVDSGLVGVEKPDPRIFSYALDPYGVAPARALHLGDAVATDIDGGRAAGLRVALIDPFGHFEGQHVDVPRVEGVVATAKAMTAARRRR